MIQLILLLSSFISVKGQISLHDTNDGIDIEFYDCVQIQSLDYCRRLRQPINLTRANDTEECEQNRGQRHTFTQLRSKNITVATLIEQWRSTREQIRQYSIFLEDLNGKNESICQCLHRGSFGTTFEETLEWQFNMRNENEEKVHIYGDVVCYETLKCDSGLLCLDWREICDGIQQCMEGKDEENCDLLEMNRCDDDEYRCMNGMCIPEEFFLDGELDCLDWSDEMAFKKSGNCPKERVNTNCDDHICPPNEWSCGDGECIADRADFQKSTYPSSCQSGRDQYFMCETQRATTLWTMPNGRCFGGSVCYSGSATDAFLRLSFLRLRAVMCIASSFLVLHSSLFIFVRSHYICCRFIHNKSTHTHTIVRVIQVSTLSLEVFRPSKRDPSHSVHERYERSAVMNRSDEEQYTYLLKCALSQGRENGCPCHNGVQCGKSIEEVCPVLIEYPRGAILGPFVFFLFNRTRSWLNKLPDVVRINGTVRCGDSLITVREKILPFEKYSNLRQMIEDHFCRSSRNASRPACHRTNESIDRCGEWNPCLSITRLNDGEKNCLNGSDEVAQTQMEIETSCAHVRRHRFRCSSEEVTCLSVTRLGDADVDCRNKFDQWWFGDGRELSSIDCNDQQNDECFVLRQYLDQSWTVTSINQSELLFDDRISFRSYCDTFRDLSLGEDENLSDCQETWICSERQSRCANGQCFKQAWLGDGEWDCKDASDEYFPLRRIMESAFKGASRHNFTSRSYFVPSRCNQSHPYLCLSAKATQQGFSCFNFSQIGDGTIDCAGAQDERNSLEHCSSLSSVLGLNFLCPSTNSCIPYYFHCSSDEYRCPRRSDDELWCDRQFRTWNCSGLNGFACFDGRCIRRGRCDLKFDCPFGEDEYMCDYSSSSVLMTSAIPHRETKRLLQRITKNSVRHSLYPTDTNITKLVSNPLSASQPPGNVSSNLSSLSPYWCNRGLGILLTKNHSIICFCPPQYYGGKYEYHADRLSVRLQLNLSRSIYTSQSDPLLVLKLLVLFVFKNETVLRDQFHLRPALQSTLVNSPKFHTHFPYPRSPSFLQQRQKRFFNRTSLLHEHPFSIRIELYGTLKDEKPSFVARWNYPILFDHLPVFHLAKVLRLRPSLPDDLNPCSSQPCHPDEQCQQTMNNKSQFLCLCKTNFRGENCSEEDQRCLAGYCSEGSLCQPNSRIPFCLCPLNRFGSRCSIKHDLCLVNPCLNQGSCVSNSQPDQVICTCTRKSHGPRCQWKRPSIHLSLSKTVPHRGAVIQFLQIHDMCLPIVFLIR